MARTRSLVLAESCALVTGASGGIGQAITRALGDRGVKLVLTGRRADELQRLVAELTARGVPARAVICDLADRAQVDQLAADAVDAGVDILVANAALPASGVLTDLTPAEIDRMLDVNLRAPIVLTRAITPAMVARGRGHLVFVSSLQGKAATPAASMYVAAKFGLRGFALALRADLRPHGVGVSLVLPGFIRDAGMYAKTGIKLPPGVGTKSPQEVADAVISAIEHNRAELDVAPVGLRLGAALASVAPGLAALGSRLMGSDRLAAQFAERQRDQR